MHKPVLIQQILEFLNLKPGKKIIDCTFGFGGHSKEILKRIKPGGKILAIEQDQELINQSVKEKRLILKKGNFKNLKKIAEENNFHSVDGILIDLGISSWHFDQSRRGFSFKGKEFLDMRLDSESSLTAEIIINEWSQEELIRIFKEYGQERFSNSVARRISQERKTKRIETTDQLNDLISQSIPGKYKHGRIHYATKIYQALRIAVNQELDNLNEVLSQALEILNPKGRMAVVSFHSLEDRIVKHFFKNEAQKGILKILTKKPIVPEEDELNLNPRSRSAKLRVLEKI